MYKDQNGQLFLHAHSELLHYFMHFHQHVAVSCQNPDLEVLGPVPTDGNPMSVTAQPRACTWALSTRFLPYWEELPVSCGEWLRTLGLSSLEKRRLRGWPLSTGGSTLEQASQTGGQQPLPVSVEEASAINNFNFWSVLKSCWPRWAFQPQLKIFEMLIFVYQKALWILKKQKSKSTGGKCLKPQ